MRIGKEFIWEMSHRLPFHKGGCQNIHGHTYKMMVEVEGITDENGMIMDYYDLEAIIAPMIKRMDHAFLVDENDSTMLNFLKEQNFKHFVVPCTTTAENIAKHLLNVFVPEFRKFENLNKLRIRFHETFDVFAEIETDL